MSHPEDEDLDFQKGDHVVLKAARWVGSSAPARQQLAGPPAVPLRFNSWRGGW
jgi:hypothetical protein